MKIRVKKFRFIAKIAQKIACLTACFAFSASAATVAKVGDMEYETLEAAFAALSSENYTLTLQDTAAWSAETPVHWAAGTQSGYAATLAAALTAAYKANEGAITIVCRPGSDVGTMTHGHVADDLTIYGNDAYLSGGECDLEVDTYTFSRATGAQAADGAYLEKDITITAYELDNLGVWGERHTAHTVTVNLTDCDGKALEGKTNVQRVYISGTTGVNDITLTDCDFLTKATAVYSNADGAIKAVNCSFTGCQVPFNINHKANGPQTVAVENCTFTDCGDEGEWKQFAAPVRLVNSGEGTMAAAVTKCTFAGTVGANGDILLGDGRTGQTSNDVTLKVAETAANIQAQKPGYYGSGTVDATKGATTTTTTAITLETSIAKLLPVDPRTLGYATSGKAAALPAAPDMNGEVVDVTAAQAQYVLDGAYGAIDGKTINFTESVADTLVIGRASKYDGSKTLYRHGSHDGEALSYADFIAYKNQSGWTESCYYERTVENVTFTAKEGVTVKNFEVEGGAHIYAGTAPVYDYVRDTGSWVEVGSCYFKRAILKNIMFKGLTFKAKTNIETSESTTVYDGFTFKDCTFDLGTTAAGNQAIRYYNENNNGNVKNLVVEGCTFKTCYQGVYTHHVKGITVKDCAFDTTGHNAIAIQSQGGEKGAYDHGAVVITGNTFKNIGDRIIRFNMVGSGTTITIADNTADGNSGRLDSATGKREIVAAVSLPENAAEIISASNNEWGANGVVGGVFADTVKTEKALRRAFFAAPTDGTAVTVTLGADITLETLYAAENFGTEKLDDNAEGDTFNRYKLGVHPTADNPNSWNPLVTGQTQEQRLVYGAYYHLSAIDERIARLVVKAGQKIILDLNGHTIQKNARANHGDWSNVCTDIIGNYGTLEIVDSSTGAKGTIKGIGYISCGGAVLHNYAGATMTVTGVNVDGNAAGMSEGTGQYVISNEGGTLTIDGANVFDTATSASLIMSNAGTVTIKNATLSHPATKLINAKGGVINIESASMTSDKYAVFVTGDARVNVNGSLTIEGTGTLKVEGNSATLTKKPGVELSAPDGFAWVAEGESQVLKSFVAKVGGTAYVTIAEAFAALNAEKHTLTLLNENAWDAATPVYWAAGAKSGYAATLAAALTAAYKADAGAITIVCRPGADVGTMTHGHVADDLTIYGNDAYLSGGECDLEVDTYQYSRETGKLVTSGGVYLDKNITITAYELDNLGVWGERHTAHTVTVNLTDCDGKALEGKTNVQRVYITGTTGRNDITLTDCDFLTKATAVFSNADGAIKAVNCSFTGGAAPFNINHKANGTQTVAVENCTFKNCGDDGDWKQFAAPLRLVNSGTGTQSAEVKGCAFAGTVGANGDILLGDGRTGQASNDVELKVVNTAANIQAQKPGYYGGETVDAAKKATATSPAEGTLETSVAQLLLVDENGNVTIPDEESLFWFARQVNEKGNTFAGKTVALTADIDLTGVSWTPIGNVTSYPGITFAGVFDGQSHVISNMTTSDTTPNHASAGLFGSICGTVKNVKLENVNVTSTHYAGGIVGYSSMSGALIENCHVDGGTVKSTPELIGGSYDNGDKVGGIAGYLVGGDRVVNCSVKNLTVTAYRDVGGLVGCSTADLSGNKVEDTRVVQSNVNAYKDEVITTFGEVCGRTLGGSNTDATTSNVTLDGPVLISTKEALIAFAAAVNGGNTFAGKTVALTADIDLTGVSWTPIGNVTSYPGITFAGVFDGQSHVIANLTATDRTPNWASAGLFGSIAGTVKNVRLTNVTITSTHYAGAIVGFTSESGSVIENCHVDGGTVTSTPEFINGKYDNGDKVGGIAGYIASDNMVTGCTVENLTVKGYRDIGGAVGYVNSTATVTGTTVKNTTVVSDRSNGANYKNYTTDEECDAGSVVGEAASTATVSGNTAETGVEVVYVAFVAQIGETKYETLQAAIAAAQDGDTVVLLKDCADAGIISLPAKVTLDGNGHRVTGNSCVYIDVAGGTIKNVVFEDIHNDAGKLSAIYAEGLSGTATITGCTFDNCDWDAIQMTPVAGAVILITGNVFDTDNTDGILQQRYVHIQSNLNVDFSATVTGNIMKGDTKQGTLEVYYFVDATKVDVSRNYIQDLADICILEKNGANVCEMAYPLYTGLTTEGAIDEHTLTDAVAIIKSTYSAQAFQTLAEALIAAESSDTVTLLADVTTTTIEVKKSITIDGGVGKHTITVDNSVKNRAFQIFGETETISVTLKNLNILNTGNAGRAICVYEKVGTVTVESCSFQMSGGGNTQPITIGGDPSFDSNIALVVKDSTIEAGNAGYGIILFHPTDVTIQNSTMTGWNAIYCKGAVTGSKGSSGSTVTATGSTFATQNIYSFESNDFAAFVAEDDNVAINLTSCTVKAEQKGSNNQYVFDFRAGDCTVRLDATTIVCEDRHLVLDSGESEVFLRGCTMDENDIPLGYVASNATDGWIQLTPPAKVFYGWLEGSTVKGGYYLLEAPFKNGWLMDGEFIILTKNVKLLEDVEFSTDEGAIARTGGQFTMLFANGVETPWTVDLNNHAFTLPANVSVQTDVQTTIFSASDGQMIVEKYDEAQGAYIYSVATPVAKIGSVFYATLAEALIAAKSGDTIEIFAGTWGADAIGTLDEPGKYTNAQSVRYKSLTIQPAEGAVVTFTSDLSLGYDDSSTANATMTVKNLNFDGASLKLSNYVQATVEGCTFRNGTSSTSGTLIVQDACCINHKTAGTYPASQVTIKNCTIDGSNDGASAIRIRNSGNVTITGNTITNSKFNGILMESNDSVDNSVAKSIVITGNTITEWNKANVAEGGRAMRLALGTLAAESTVSVANNVFRKATTGLDSPDFAKITGVGAATVSLDGNDWNDELRSTVSGNAAYYTVDTTSPVLLAGVVTTKHEPVAQVTVNGVTTKYTTFEDALVAANAATDATITLLDDVTYATNGSGLWNITSSMTLDGGGHALNGYGTRSGNKTTLAINNGGSAMVAVTLKNLTIRNEGTAGRPIETRGNISSLTLENCEVTATGSGNNQGITIGGNQSSAAKVVLKNTTVAAGQSGYPYISFNPATVEISGGTLSGYCGMYFKGVNGSTGSRGTVVTATGTNFDCPNVHEEGSNDFGVFVLEDDGITINLMGCRVNSAVQGTARQAVVMTSGYAERSTQPCSISITGSETHVNGELMDNMWDKEPVLSVSGGTFSNAVLPEYCAAGFIPTENGDGTYGVTETFKSVNVKPEVGSDTTINVRMTDTLLNKVAGANLEDKVSNLNKQEENGNLAWVNLVAGIDKTKKVTMAAPQNDDTEVINVDLPAVDTALVGTDVTVRYEIRAEGSDAADVSTTKAEDLVINLDDRAGIGIYRTYVCLLQNGKEVARVASENALGVLQTVSAAKKTIIAVPWLSLKDGNAIAVADLVKTAGLTVGDKLHVYNKAASRYDVYELEEDEAGKVWKPKAIYKVRADGTVETVSSGTPETTTVARGNGVWLERQDTEKAIVSYGQVASVEVATTIDAGTAETPTWNLLAVPATTAVNVAKTFGTSAADTLIVPTAGAPKICTVKDGAWWYEKSVPVTDASGNQLGVRVVRENVTELPAGTGFWYLNGGAAKTVNW